MKLTFKTARAFQQYVCERGWYIFNMSHIDDDSIEFELAYDGDRGDLLIMANNTATYISTGEFYVELTQTI